MKQTRLRRFRQSAITILYTGGQRIYSKNEEDIPELTLNSPKTIDIFDTYFELADTDNVNKKNAAAFFEMKIIIQL